MITNQNAEHRMAAHLQILVANSGVTKKFIYTGLDMSRETFDTRLRNPHSFTYRNMIRLAEILRVNVSDLIPAENQQQERLVG